MPELKQAIWMIGEAMTHATLHGVKIGSNTTMDLPHRRLEYAGKVYFIATFPEGDLSVHEWSPRDPTGYGGSLVTFLLDDGTLETVKGPFECNDMFDFGRAAMLKGMFGIEAKPTAVQIRVGKNLKSYMTAGPEDVIYEDETLSCDPIGPRVASLLDRGIPEDAEWQFVYRGAKRHIQSGEIRRFLSEIE